MAAGEYELALPVALDAVQQGQALFKPAPALQLFPLYLLAAQVLPSAASPPPPRFSSSPVQAMVAQPSNLPCRASCAARCSP
jgi:hypothetical protein